MIVLLGSQKGGTGKSTLATNIAVSMAHLGRDVLLLDADPQKTASRWCARRAEGRPDAPKVHCVERNGENLFHTLKDLAGRYGDIVIDTGGHDGVEFRSALLAAQVLYCPMRASQADLETTQHVSSVLEAVRATRTDGGPAARAILTMTPTHYLNREATDAKDYLEAHTGLKMAGVQVHDRKVYRDAMLEGLGVIEMGNPDATEEIRRLSAEILGGSRVEANHVPV